MKFKEKLVHLKAHYDKTTNDVINETGISIYEYEACESGLAEPSSDFLLKIANYYKVNISDLLNDDIDINEIINDSKISETQDVYVDYDFSGDNSSNTNESNNSNFNWDEDRYQGRYSNGTKTSHNDNNEKSNGFQNGNNMNNSSGPFNNGSNMNHNGPFNNGNGSYNNGNNNSYNNGRFNNTNNNSNADEGSTVIGFVLGFLFGCFALIFVAMMGKPKTKKGCIIGFFVSLIFNIICSVILGSIINIIAIG